MNEVLFRPSESGSWIKCNMSVVMKLLYPDGNIPHEVTNEGVEFHEIMYKLFKEGYKGHPLMCTSKYTADIKSCVDYIKGMTKKGLVDKRYLETKVNLDFILGSGSGTCDMFFVYKQTLHIVDYKYGYTKVDSKNNKQLMLYALGILNNYQKLCKGVSRVRLHILQPRINNFSSSPVSFTKLNRFKNKIKKIVLNTLLGDIKAYPSIDACRYCKGLLKCSYAYKHAKEVSDLNNYELFKQFDYLSAYNEKFKQDALKKLKNSEDLGYKNNLYLRKVNKRKVWRNDSIRTVIELLGDDVAFVDGRLITPSEARNHLAYDVIDSLIVKDTIPVYRLGGN